MWNKPYQLHQDRKYLRFGQHEEYMYLDKEIIDTPTTHSKSFKIKCNCLTIYASERCITCCDGDTLCDVNGPYQP